MTNNINIYSLIGENIRRVRKARGFTQKTLAEAIGVTPQQVQKYESGANQITCVRLLELCCLLDCDTKELLGDLAYNPASLYPTMVLDATELELISYFRALKLKDRITLINFIQCMAPNESAAS